MRKTIMILGGSVLQLPAIHTALNMGLEVVVLDRNPNAPGMKLAHHAVAVDFTDRGASVREAIKHDIDGILTISSDLPVPTVGRICDILKLPGISEEVGEMCSNKVRMKERLVFAGVPTPVFIDVKDENDLLSLSKEFHYPLMVKAADNSGSRGVSRVDDPTQIHEAYRRARRHSRCGRVIVEKFIEGREFGAQVFVKNGDIVLILPHNDTLSPAPYYIPIGHSLPFRTEGYNFTSIELVIVKAIRALGISHGAVNMDMILSPLGPMVIEVGARFGGTCLPTLTSFYTGVNLVEQVIRLALGEECDFAPRKYQPVAALLITSPMDGVLKGVRVDNAVYRLKGIEEIQLDVKPGDKIRRFTSGADRIGHIITTGTDDIHAENLARKVRSLITIEL